MQIRTLSALSALGMLLTSYSVWSLTERNGAPEPAPFRAGAEEQPQRPTLAGADAAAFVTQGTLRTEARLGHARLAADSPMETFVLVNVRADDKVVGRSASRHLAIVIDRSGSMAGKRLNNALAAAEAAVRKLSSGDRVSVIEYASSARLLVPVTELDAASRERVIAQIRGVTAGGDTCISCALDASLQTLGRFAGVVDRVLLVSDGEATAGIRDVDGMRRVAEGIRNAGASVTTIGVDVDYNERMLAAISEVTNGRHYFVESPEGLARIFDRELSGLERTVAREARLELEPAPGVEIVEVVDRGFVRRGSRVFVSLGSFSAGEERGVLARVRIASGTPGSRPVASARLDYADLASGKQASSEGQLVATLTGDGSRSALDPMVEERVQRTGTVSALNEANGLFQAGDFEGAKKRLDGKLDEVRSRRSQAVAAAPAARRPSIEREFAKQEAALGNAASAFAEPPKGGSAAEVSRGKAASKRNQAAASDLAF
jgi:Ca-activated chloride channel family protein